MLVEEFSSDYSNKMLGDSMKKILKSIFAFVLVGVCILGFTACAPKVSKTTVNTSKVASSNGVTTNGGTTAIYNGYLYFINGTKTNDGKHSTGNTRGAICRVKYDQATGTVTDKTYEVVVRDLVGFNYGSLNFFGDFLYYTSPSSDVNYKGDVLYYKTRFMRYDLVNKHSQTIYITKKNAEKETTTYSYYVTGNNLNLVVYESQNATVTSIKIGDNFTTNYVINNVKSCVLSENYGKCVTEGKSVDANNFVFYTKANDAYDKYQTGSKVYRTLPNKNSSYCLSNEGLDITPLSIRNGKLVFSYSSRIYANFISGESNEKLSVDTQYVISYSTYDDLIFIENKDGSISVLYYDKNNYQIVVITWTNGVSLESTTINVLSKSESFSFVGLATINEVIEEESTTPSTDEPATPAAEEPTTPSTGEGTDEPAAEPKLETVTYAIYVENNAVYKIEIEREGVISAHAQPVKLTKSKVSEPAGTLIPEVIGNNIFILANQVDKNDKETGKVYLHMADLTIKDDSTEYAKMVGIKE